MNKEHTQPDHDGDAFRGLCYAAVAGVIGNIVLLSVAWHLLVG